MVTTIIIVINVKEERKYPVCNKDRGRTSTAVLYLTMGYISSLVIQKYNNE